MPLRRIKIIRRNGTSAFSDNSNLSVSESLGTVVASLLSPTVTRPNSKKFYQNNRYQGLSYQGHSQLSSTAHFNPIDSLIWALMSLIRKLEPYGMAHTTSG